MTRNQWLWAETTQHNCRWRARGDSLEGFIVSLFTNRLSGPQFLCTSLSCSHIKFCFQDLNLTFVARKKKLLYKKKKHTVSNSIYSFSLSSLVVCRKVWICYFAVIYSVAKTSLGISPCAPRGKNHPQTDVSQLAWALSSPVPLRAFSVKQTKGFSEFCHSSCPHLNKSPASTMAQPPVTISSRKRLHIDQRTQNFFWSITNDGADKEGVG